MDGASRYEREPLSGIAGERGHKGVDAMEGVANGSREVGENDRAGGAKGRNRTADTSIFSAVLYRLSYLGVAAE